MNKWICTNDDGQLCKHYHNGKEIKLHCLGCCREYGCYTEEESREYMDYPKLDLFEPQERSDKE